MPELPEVQTICNELQVKLNRQHIKKVIVRRPSIINMPSRQFTKLLTGQDLLTVARRSKIIVIQLSTNWLLVHLRMTGSFIYEQGSDIKSAATNKHSRIIIQFSDNNKLVYQDVRALGKMYLLDTDQKNNFLSKYGPEPLTKDFTKKILANSLKKRKLPIKQFLLDQKEISGIGNIYASEILFQAKINPLTKANVLEAKQINKLYKAIRSILQKAIAEQGTTFSDYRQVSGKVGNFQNLLQVYGKAGQKCPRCLKTILKIVIGGRSSFYCKKCQPTVQ